MRLLRAGGSVQDASPLPIEGQLPLRTAGSWETVPARRAEFSGSSR
jgi:hypothetical protein